MQFEWDDAKAASNARKHGVTFDTARDAFDDPDSVGSRKRIISAREADRHEQDRYQR